MRQPRGMPRRLSKRSFSPNLVEVSLQNLHHVDLFSSLQHKIGKLGKARINISPISCLIDLSQPTSLRSAIARPRLSKRVSPSCMRLQMSSFRSLQSSTTKNGVFHFTGGRSRIQINQWNLRWVLIDKVRSVSRFEIQKAGLIDGTDTRKGLVCRAPQKLLVCGSRPLCAALSRSRRDVRGCCKADSQADRSATCSAELLSSQLSKSQRPLLHCKQDVAVVLIDHSLL